MDLALHYFVFGTAGPDRLADSTNRPTAGTLAIDEVLPHRNDAGGVDPDQSHVREHHMDGGRAEGVSKHGETRLGHDDENGLAPVDPFEDERQRTGEELIVVGVEQRLVAKAARAGRVRVDGQRHDGAPCSIGRMSARPVNSIRRRTTVDGLRMWIERTAFRA